MKGNVSMERTGWQRTWVRVLITTMTASVMLLIFFFSNETADRSDQTSGIFARAAIGIAYPDFSEMPEDEQEEIYNVMQHLVRKTAHFTEYALLGLLIRFCMQSWIGSRKHLLPAAWTFGTLYAATDELHQLLTDGRAGQWTDVVLDSSGVLAGAVIAAVVVVLGSRAYIAAKEKEDREPDGLLQKQ